MSALQRTIYKHMQNKGILLTDGSEKEKKVCELSFWLWLSISQNDRMFDSTKMKSFADISLTLSLTCQFLTLPIQ